MLLLWFIPVLRKLVRELLSIIKRLHKRQKKKKTDVEMDAFESLKKEREKLLKESQMLEQENDLLYLHHLKTLVGMKADIGR